MGKKKPGFHGRYIHNGGGGEVISRDSFGTYVIYYSYV